MKQTFNRVLEKIKRPPLWAKVLTAIVTPLSIAGALLILLIDFEQGFLAIVAYLLFALAAISLSYSVFLIVPLIPKIKRGVTERMHRYEFTDLLLSSYGFRTIVFTFCSLLMGVAFSIFNAVMGIVYRSIWYGALAAYYIGLVFMRGGLVLRHARPALGNKKKKQAQTYRNCGIVLLVLNIALSSAIAQMIFDDRAFEYAGWTIYAYAAYAFFRISTSAYNLFKARKQDELTVQAARNVNFTGAAVSILALQTALLHTFGDEGLNISLFNTLTGSVVSILSVLLAVTMIVVGQKRMKKESEETNE